MIFLAVTRFSPSRDVCEACGAPGVALLFTTGGRHWIKDRNRDVYHGGPDVFVLRTEHAAAAELVMRSDRVEALPAGWSEPNGRVRAGR